MAPPASSRSSVPASNSVLVSDAKSPPTNIADTPASTTATLPPPSPPLDRLGLPFAGRLFLSASLSLLTGFTLSYTIASRLAALRFRAENAHRLPRSTPDWYLYHKSKNYYGMYHGITAGVRSGSRLAGWSALFMGVEEGVDRLRGSWVPGWTYMDAGREVENDARGNGGRMDGLAGIEVSREKRSNKTSDALSSVAAGLTTAAVWILRHGLGRGAASRTLAFGAIGGLLYGGLQDGLRWVRKSGWVVEDERESWLYRDAKNRQGHAFAKTEQTEGRRQP